jgi:hypothetical protein
MPNGPPEVRTSSLVGDMKSFRNLLALTAATANLFCLGIASAADKTPAPPPVIVPPGHGNHNGNGNGNGNGNQDLQGVPDNVKNLIETFDQTRDKYLQQQRLMLIKLHHATTPEEQDQIRQQLQTNRKEFLAELKGFREELRADLQALKGKISHGEFGRIIDAANSAASDGGHRHRGQ